MVKERELGSTDCQQVHCRTHLGHLLTAGDVVLGLVWSFTLFKETCVRGHQRAVSPKSRYFATVGQSIMKTVADRHGHAAAYHNKH